MSLRDKMSAKDIDSLSDILSKTGVNNTDNEKILSFASRSLKLDDEESATEIVQAIENCNGLEVLELKGNTLGVAASKVIGKALEKQSNLKRALWSDLFTGRSKAEIPPALINLCSGMRLAGAGLVELDLSDNAFGPNGMTGLTEFLKSQSCYSLKELRLNNNGLGITGGKMLADSLLSCYHASNKMGQPIALKVFVSGRGRLENEGATALAEAFKLMRSLVEVHMPQNGINHPGITALAGALALNKNLRILNLSDNTFTEEGSVSMATAIKQLHNLEEVNFEDCLVRTNGAISIGHALSEGHEKLKVLKLSGNEISIEGAKVIVSAIENKSNLETLELNANQLGEEGIKFIKDSFVTMEKSSVLGSFSDDEGDDDDDGDDDNDEEDEAEDNNHVDKVKPNAKPGIQDYKLEEDIESLLESPTKAKLKEIVAKNSYVIPSYLEDRIDKLDEAVLALMKLAQLCDEGDYETNGVIFSYADDFIKMALGDVSKLWLVNSIVLSLGLIKAETGNVRLPKDYYGPLVLLQHIIKQEYFSRESRNVLSYFLENKKSCLGGYEVVVETIINDLSKSRRQ